MKKAIALLLTLSILLGCSASLAEVATSFEADALTLQQIALPQAADAQEICWKSLSPLVNSGIAMVGDVVCAYYGGTFHPIVISQDKGVADEYGNLNKICFRFLNSNTPLHDIRFSPDGRYAMILSWKQVLMNMNMIFDPILLDLSTGELILLETHDNKPSKPNSAAACSAVFSSDGRSVYYVLYGNLNETVRCTLHRCDLDTLQTEMLGALTDTTYRTDLCELPDGSLMLVNGHLPGTPVPGNLVIFHPDTRTMEMKSAANQSLELPDRTLNVQAHRAVMASTLNGADYTRTELCFQVFDPAAPENATMYGIGPDGQPVVTTRDELVAMAQENNVTLEPIFCSALSPDGEYELLLVYSTSAAKPQWIMVRLSDMAARPVSGPELDPLTAVDADIFWPSDAVLVYTQTAQAYTFPE